MKQLNKLYLSLPDEVLADVDSVAKADSEAEGNREGDSKSDAVAMKLAWKDLHDHQVTLKDTKPSAMELSPGTKTLLTEARSRVDIHSLLVGDQTSLMQRHSNSTAWYFLSSSC